MTDIDTALARLRDLEARAAPEWRERARQARERLEGEQ